MTILTALLAGLIFGIGLLISGMTNPAKIQNKRTGTIFGEAFQWPTRQDIDARLIAGASMFGVGWGLGGFCPGPALAALPLVFNGITGAIWFVPAMLIGLLVAKYNQ